MKAWIQRWKYRLMIFHDYGKDLNQRTTVQIYLYDCATGRKPLPDKTKCRELANNLSLGIK